MDRSQSSSQQHEQSSCYRQQPTTPSTVIQQLKHIYNQVLQKQRHQLSQLLNLQKLLNHIHSTVPITRDDIAKIQKLNQTNRLKQQQKKIIMNKGFNLERIGQKIQQIIQQTPDQVIVAVEEDIQQQRQKQQTVQTNNRTQKKTQHTTSSNTTNSRKKITIIPSSTFVNKAIVKTNKQPILIEKKKPPIPTGNRNTNDIINRGSTTKYIPPRNKNEVTGKVTQTKIMTQQKVFKPEINTNTNINSSSSQHKSTTINKLPATSSSSIGSTATTINKSSTITNTKTINTVNTTAKSSVIDKNLNKQSIPSLALQDANSISEYKNLRMVNNKQIRLKQFNKPIEQLYQQSVNNNKTNKNNNKQKKYNFKQLIEKYTQQQMGHKNLQQKRRQQYIKKLNNFGLSINTNINCNQITNSINKRLWNGYPSIYEFNQLLQKLQQDIQKLQYQYKEDLRSDPKVVYRVQCMGRLIQREVGEIMGSTEIEVPQKIQLTFTAPINSNNNKKAVAKQQQQQQTTTATIKLQQFYQQLSQLIKQTHQNQSLSTKDLSLLRVISQIVLYDGKRAPLIVKTDQLQQWRQSYSQVQSSGDSNGL